MFKYLVLIFLLGVVVSSDIPKYLKCINLECSETISMGRVKKTVESVQGELNNVKIGKVKILGKNNDDTNNLWLIEQDGAYGFIDKNEIKELKLDIKTNLETVSNPHHAVNDDTETTEPDKFKNINEDETESIMDRVVPSDKKPIISDQIKDQQNVEQPAQVQQKEDSVGKNSQGKPQVVEQPPQAQLKEKVTDKSSQRKPQTVEQPSQVQQKEDAMGKESQETAQNVEKPLQVQLKEDAMAKKSQEKPQTVEQPPQVQQKKDDTGKKSQETAQTVEQPPQVKQKEDATATKSQETAQNVEKPLQVQLKKDATAKSSQEKPQNVEQPQQVKQKEDAMAIKSQETTQNVEQPPQVQQKEDATAKIIQEKPQHVEQPAQVQQKEDATAKKSQEKPQAVEQPPQVQQKEDATAKKSQEKPQTVEQPPQVQQKEDATAKKSQEKPQTVEQPAQVQQKEDSMGKSNEEAIRTNDQSKNVQQKDHITAKHMEEATKLAEPKVNVSPDNRQQKENLATKNVQKRVQEKQPTINKDPSNLEQKQKSDSVIKQLEIQKQQANKPNKSHKDLNDSPKRRQDSLDRKIRTKSDDNIHSTETTLKMGINSEPKSLIEPWIQSTCSADNSDEYRSTILRLIGYFDTLSQKLIRTILIKSNLKSTKLEKLIETIFQVPFENVITLISLVFTLVFVSFLPRLLGYRRNYFLEYQIALEKTNALKHELKTIEGIRDDLIKQNCKFETVIESYKDELNKMKTDSLKNRENIDQMTVNFDNKIKQKVQEYKELKGHYIQVETGIKERDRKLEVQRKESNEQIQKLNVEKKQLNESINKLQKTINESNEFNSELNNKIDQMKKECAELNDEINELKQDIEHKNNEYNTLEQSFKNLQALEDLNDDEYRDKLEKSIENTELKTKLEQLNDRITQLSESLDDNSTELTKQRNLSKEYELERNRAVEEREEALAKKVDAQKALEVMREYFESREVTIQRTLGHQEVNKSNSEEQFQKFKNEIEELKNQLEKRNSQIEQLKKELYDVSKKAHEQQNKATEALMDKLKLEKDLNSMCEDNRLLRSKLSYHIGPVQQVPIAGYGGGTRSPVQPPPVQQQNRANSRHSGDSFDTPKTSKTKEIIENGIPVVVSYDYSPPSSQIYSSNRMFRPLSPSQPFTPASLPRNLTTNMGSSSGVGSQHNYPQKNQPANSQSGRNSVHSHSKRSN